MNGKKRDIPKGHFKFYYTSVVDRRETYVLLDVLHTSHGYPKVITVPVKNNLFFLGTQFTKDEARVAAGKVALLATILKGGGNQNVEKLRYTNESNNQIKDVLFEGRFQILNKLKANIPEAFYYWWLVQKLQTT